MTVLNHRFAGRLDFFTNDPEFAGPYPNENVAFGLRFNTDLTSFGIVDFVTLVVPDIPTKFLVTDTLTVTHQGGEPGVFDASTGSASVLVKLRFSHEIAGPFPNPAPSKLRLIMTTNATKLPDDKTAGQPLDLGVGEVDWVGTGMFKEGHLAGTSCWVHVTGHLTPAPT